MTDYAHPEVLVDTQWVAEHLNDPKVRIVDAHIDPAPYESGHIPGAVFWNGFETRCSNRTGASILTQTP